MFEAIGAVESEGSVEVEPKRRATPPAGLPWTASFDIELPSSGQYRIHPSMYEHIAQLMHGSGPVFTVRRSSMEISFGVEAADAPSAQSVANRLGVEILKLFGLSASVVNSISVYNKHAEHTPTEDVPECVGASEAAEILGVSKQRFHQLAQRRGFPAPIFRLKATPVWRRAAVEEFARCRETTAASL